MTARDGNETYVMIPVTYVRSKERPKPKGNETFRCIRCNAVFYKRTDRGHGSKRYCLECEHEKEKAMDRAGYRIKKAIKAGKILPATSYECWDCSEPADRYDHRNYDKPLDVQPVCARCNRRRGPADWGTHGIA